MNEPVIREARKSDVAAIVGLLAEDFLGQSREDPSSPPRREYLDAFDEMARDANQMMIVMEQDGAIVGCLQISVIPGLTLVGTRRGQIEGVHIASTHRGRGLGHRLLQWSIEECRRRGCGLVQLTANKARRDAHRFYASLGFEATHEGFKRAL
jgi:ribosomal protein S18 acetylase RimI-like enzyme